MGHTLDQHHIITYFLPFPFLPAVLDGHYMSSHFQFPLILGSQCVYLFIFPSLSFLLFWMDTIYPVIFYFLYYSDHSESTYLFPLSIPSYCLVGHYISSQFLFSFLIGSQCVYLFISLFLSFLLFWMDTICPVILYFLCYSDHSVSTYLFPLSYTSCCSGWTLYMQSFSISSVLGSQCVYLFISPFLYFLLFWMDTIYAVIFYFLCTWITVCLLIYFPFLSFLLFWMETIYPVIFYFLCYLDNSESTYLFRLSFTSCCSGWTPYVQSFLFPLLLGSQCVYLFIFPFLDFCFYFLPYVSFCFSDCTATLSSACFYSLPFLSASLTTLQIYLLPVSILFPMFLSASLTAVQLYLLPVSILFPMFLSASLTTLQLYLLPVSILFPMFLSASLTALQLYLLPVSILFPVSFCFSDCTATLSSACFYSLPYVSFCFSDYTATLSSACFYSLPCFFLLL